MILSQSTKSALTHLNVSENMFFQKPFSVHVVLCHNALSQTRLGGFYQYIQDVSALCDRKPVLHVHHFTLLLKDVSAEIVPSFGLVASCLRIQSL